MSDPLDGLRSVYVGRNKAATPAEREQAIKFLHNVLDRPHIGSDWLNEWPARGPREEPPRFQNQFSPEPLPKPFQELALSLAYKLHPTAFSTVRGNPFTFRSPGEQTGGSFVRGDRSIGFGPNSPLNDTFEGSMDTLRHELAHAGGLEHESKDPRIPTAWDVDFSSSALHRDIKLPTERKR